MRIIWLPLARKNVKDIFDYHKINASYNVARNIRKQIFNSTRQLSRNPLSGQEEFYLSELRQNHKYLVSGNYKIIYRIEREQILIIDVFDTRQHPDKIIDENRE